MPRCPLSPILKATPTCRLYPLSRVLRLSQVVYYAANIVGDNASCAPTCNTITVNFNQAATSPDVRFLEYSGLNPTNPLDAAVGNFGTGATADTGACSTKSASELIVAAATTNQAVGAAGPGFTTVDVTFNGDNVEHQITSEIGSCEAQALINPEGNWVITSVSFKSGAAAGPGFTLTANAANQSERDRWKQRLVCSHSGRAGRV